MEPSATIQKLYTAALDINEPYSSLSKDEKEHVQSLLTRFEKLEAKHGALPRSEILRPLLLSKVGRYEDALAFAEQSFKRTPNWETAVAVANAARRAGDIERAAAMFSKGAALDPDDDTCLLEVGDIRLEQGRFADALAAYEKVLAQDSEHQWALPSAFFCRHKLKLKGNWLASLNEVAEQQGCTCGMEGCLSSIFGGYGSSAGIDRAKYLLSKIRRRPTKRSKK